MFFQMTCLVLTCLMSSFVYAAEDNQDETQKKADVLRSSKGIQFRVPDDWPLETRNRAVGPVSIEEYLSLKFKKLEERITVLENKVDNLTLVDSKKSVVKSTNRFQSYEHKSATLLGDDHAHESVS